MNYNLALSQLKFRVYNLLVFKIQRIDAKHTYFILLQEPLQSKGEGLLQYQL